MSVPSLLHIHQQRIGNRCRFVMFYSILIYFIIIRLITEGLGGVSLSRKEEGGLISRLVVPLA